MNSLRSRLILIHILPVLIVLPFVAIVLILLLESQVLLANMSEGLSEKAMLIAEVVNGQPEIWGDEEMATGFARRMGIQVDEQVWLIKPSGELLAAEGNDSVFAPLTDESLLALGIGEHQVSVSYGLFRQTGEVYVPVRDVNQELLGIVGVSEELAD